MAAAFFGGQAILTALQPPAQAIRSELVAAAAELSSRVGPQPTEAQTRAIQRHFRSHAAAGGTESWPQVSVTLRHLDRATCIDATSLDSPIEGLVVIELERYRSAQHCSDDNDMTWWMLP